MGDNLYGLKWYVDEVKLLFQIFTKKVFKN